MSLSDTGPSEPIERPDTEQHRSLEEVLEGAPAGTGAPGDATTEQLMSSAIGGWRGLIDSSLPGAVFVLAYLVSGSQLRPAIWAAVGAGVLIAVFRLVRRESLRQVVSGFLGIAFAAWLASRTGKAENFYLPGLLTNAGYGVALAVSCVVGHPLLGYGVGAATGDVTGWRAVPEQRRAYALATWFFVALFLCRIVIEVPLYLAGQVGALGIMKLVLGWPLFAAAAFLAYRVISKARAEAPVPVAMPVEDEVEPTIE
ncbi:MAG: DUF3159 domain-containing protein [Actinomycetes bacterium]